MPISCSPIRIMRVSGPARTRGMKDHGLAFDRMEKAVDYPRKPAQE